MKLVLDVLEAREIINQQTVGQQKETREKFEKALELASVNAPYINDVLKNHKMTKGLAEKAIREYYELRSLCLLATGHELIKFEKMYPMLDTIQFNNTVVILLGWYDECEQLLEELGAC